MDRDYPLPTAERLVAIYRECGAPHYDQEMARSVLESDLTDEQKVGAFALLGTASAFASDDPAVWAEAEAILATLDTLAAPDEQGADWDGYLDRVGAVIMGRSDEVVLALLHLQRTRLVAAEHVLRRRAASDQS